MVWDSLLSDLGQINTTGVRQISEASVSVSKSVLNEPLPITGTQCEELNTSDDSEILDARLAELAIGDSKANAVHIIDKVKQ